MRLWAYQRERFPLAGHAPLVAAFSGGVTCASAALRGADGPGWGPVAVAVVVALGVFFQLRVADEWKDADRDAALQPDRPVPRGLVTLRELVAVAGVVALVQLAVTAWLSLALVGVLVAVWAFAAAMTVEFGVGRWLRGRPVAVLVSHGFVVPFVDAFAVAADVLGNGAALPEGVEWLVGVSLFGGMVVEVGRKIKAPPDEVEGVETYSALWGRRGALVRWAGILTASALCGVVVLGAAGALGVAPLLMVGSTLALGVALSSLGRDTPGAGRRVEVAAGLWTLALYLTLGPAVLAARASGLLA